MSQTSVANQSQEIFAGALVVGTPYIVDTHKNEEAADEIPFGVMVAAGVADDGALKVADAADRLLGVVAHSHHYGKDRELGDTGLKPKTAMRILRQGRIWVVVSEAVTPASPVRITEAGGGFLTTAVAGVTVDCSAFAQFKSSAGAGGLVQLAIDMTNSNLATAD